MKKWSEGGEKGLVVPIYTLCTADCLAPGCTDACTA